jgi:hypothetical protein
MPFVSRDSLGVRRGELLKELLENAVKFRWRKIMNDNFSPAATVEDGYLRPKTLL